MKNNVALCGWKQSGKSRAAALFKKEGYTVKKFAAPLKRIVSKSFGIENIEDKEQIVNVEYAVVSDKAKYIVKNILMEFGMSEFGAETRLYEESCQKSPIQAAGGKCVVDMFKDVADMLFDLQKKALTEPVKVRHILQQLGTDVMRSWDKDIHVNLFDANLEDKEFPIVVDDARFPNEMSYLHSKGCKSFWLHRPSLVPTDLHESEVSIGESDCYQTVRSNEGELLDASVTHYLRFDEWNSEDIM